MSEDNFWSEENEPQSNWFSFDVVGAKIRGIVVDIFEKPSTNPQYPDQKIFVLRVEESSKSHEVGSLVNTPIKKTSDFLMGRTYSVKAGDRLGFLFAEEIPPTKKGNHPAKSIKVYHTKDVDADLVAARKNKEAVDNF